MRVVAAAVCLVAAGTLASVHPLPLPMGIFVLTAAIVVSVQPSRWLSTFVAALPLVNLYRWSGWHVPSEFDIVGLAVVGTVLARNRRAHWTWPLGRIGTGFVILLCAGTLLSLIAGLRTSGIQPASGLPLFYDASAPIFALRGLAWAVLAIGLTGFQRDTDQVIDAVAIGLVIGVLGLGVTGGYERLAFTGLINFSYPLRITANFPGTTLGGGQFGTYLAISFAASLWLISRGGLRRTLGTVAGIVAIYLVLVTFARTALVALAISGFVTVIALLFIRLRTAGPKNQLGIAVACLSIAVPAVYLATNALDQKTVLDARLNDWREDLAQRSSLWIEGLDIGPTDALAHAVGRGPGTFPASAHKAGFAGTKPPKIQLPSEPDGSASRYLELGGGAPVYIEQMVRLEDTSSLTLTAQANTPPDTSLRIHICEKTALYSVACASANFHGRRGGWHPVTATLDTRSLKHSAEWFSRPATLALAVNAPPNATVGVDDVTLTTDSGRQLLDNNTFDQGWSHWFISSDNHAIWRLENMFLMTFWERGGLGLILLIVGLFGATATALVQICRGKRSAALTLGILVAIAASGLTNALIDVPVVETLLWLLIYLGILPQSNAIPDARTPRKARRMRNPSGRIPIAA